MDSGLLEELVPFQNGELPVSLKAGARGDFKDIPEAHAPHPNTLLPLTTRPHQQSISL